MKIALNQLARLQQPVTVTILSLDRSLYQMTACINNEEHVIVEEDGKTCRSHSLQQLRDKLEGLPVSRVNLRHTSAYDEMIGHPERTGSNALEVSLSSGHSHER